MIELLKQDSRIDLLLRDQEVRTDSYYVPSRFLIQFCCHNRSVVVNNLTKRVILSSLQDRRYSPEEILSDVELSELVKSRFLVPEDKDETADYLALNRLLRTVSRSKGLNYYSILTTTACNARCAYCFQEDMLCINMKAATAEALVDFIERERDAEKPVVLTWFGGEPFLKTDIIDRICKGLTDKKVEFISSSFTNGSFLSDVSIDKMICDWRLKSIQISMDGSERDYIKRKNYRSYNDTYHKVIDAAASLAEHGIKVSIRVNVDFENIDDAHRLADDFARIVKKKENFYLYYSPLYGERAGEHDLQLWNRIIEETRYVEGLKIPTSLMIGFPRIMVTRHCRSGHDGVTVYPDGGLYMCEQCIPNSRYGDVFNGITDFEAEIEFMRLDKFPDKCRTCPFLPDCTPFSSCPIKDRHCRELHMMMAEAEIERLVKTLEASGAASAGGSDLPIIE